MRIGYIVLCHKEPELVAKIVNKVTKGTDNIAVIHVDRKSDDMPFKDCLRGNEQAYFTRTRIKNYWGGFSSVQATMFALEMAYNMKCDRYVLLQGADYPLHSNEDIDEFFNKHANVEFLKAYNVTKSQNKINYMKCWGYHIYDGVDRRKVCLKTFIARGFEAINKVGIKYRRGYYYDKKQSKRYDIYWGWAHFALTRQCVEYVLDEYKNNEGLNRYFRHTFPADETYLQTVIYNSHFVENTVDGGALEENTHGTNESMLNLTYFEYPGLVRVFDNTSEIERKKTSKFIYIRKVTQKCALELDRYGVQNHEKSNNC